MPIRGADEQIADYSLTALIHKKRIADYATILNRGVPGKNLGIDVAQDHVRGAAIVPRHPLCPDFGLAVQQRTQVSRCVMPEVENLHGFQGTAPHIHRKFQTVPAAIATAVLVERW